MTRQLRANQRIDPFVFSRRPEVSTLTTAGVKYSSPWPSVKRVLSSLLSVSLKETSRVEKEGREGVKTADGRHHGHFSDSAL